MSFESQYATSYIVINSNLGPILHRLATIHQWRMTNRQATTTTKGRP